MACEVAVFDVLDKSFAWVESKIVILLRSYWMCKGYDYSIDAKARETITMRYKRITEAVNRRFWNYVNDAAHSLYVGSYGRGTAINTSDIDSSCSCLMLLKEI